LTYWYDAFTGDVIADLNRKLPQRAQVDFLNDSTNTSVIVFQELQALGALRADILLVAREADKFPYVWLLTQDSKSSAFTRLLFALVPWYTSEPHQLDDARVASVADPVAVSRAWALQLLLDAPDRSRPDPPAAPNWVREYAPWLARFWGDGLMKAKHLALNQDVLAWSRSDPEGLLAAAKEVATNRTHRPSSGAQRLMDLLTDSNRHGPRAIRTQVLLDERPEALVEAIQILNGHRDQIVKVMSRYGYTDPRALGGYLDRDLATVVDKH
jgi:hypothetical protein